MNLATKKPIKDDTDYPIGHCLFCDKLIEHVNDGGVGCVAGGVLNGEVLHYIYCNDPMCEERVAAQGVGDDVADCFFLLSPNMNGMNDEICSTSLPLYKRLL